VQAHAQQLGVQAHVGQVALGQGAMAQAHRGQAGGARVHDVGSRCVLEMIGLAFAQGWRRRARGPVDA